MIIKQYNDVKNQFEIRGENFTALQSYGSLVVVKFEGDIYLGNDHSYSKTTNKYVKEFTGYNEKEREDMLEKGVFKPITSDLLSKLKLGEFEYD